MRSALSSGASLVQHMCCTNATDILLGVSTIDPHLVAAAARVLDREGRRGLTLTGIAEEAGVSRVTVHRRGAGTDDYLVAVLGRASDDLRESLWPVLTGEGSAAQRLERGLRILCDVCERHRGVMAAMFAAPALPVPGQPGRTTSFQFIEPFERLVRDGQLDGSLRSTDPLPDATMTANAVAWTFLHMRAAHGWDRATATDRIVELAIAHLLPGTNEASHVRS